MTEKNIAEIWFLSLTEISRKRRIRYLKDRRSVFSLYKRTEKRDCLKQYFTAEECQLIDMPERKEYAASMAADLEQKAIRYCFYQDPAYPAALLDIPDPPCGLFYLGELPRSDRFQVGIVGARLCTEYGRRVAQELGQRLAGYDIGIVSGMAAGIDSASFAGSLSAGGSNYAVLGSGCDVCYPSSSRNIYTQIPLSGGVISEYLPQTKPLPYHFPERNRLISGLSDVLVVVEAREKSGSLITVDCALDQGKDVYSVPGRIGDRTSAGCNRLIRQGAAILCDIDWFLEEIMILAKEKRKWKQDRKEQDLEVFMKPPLEKEEQLVYSCLDLHPKNVFLLLEETGLQLDQLLFGLKRLTDAGLAEEVLRNAYSRSFAKGRE